MVRPLPTILFSRKTKLNKLSHNIKNLDTFFFRFITIHAFDRRTDRQTDRQTDRRTDGRTPFSRLDRTAFNAAG